MILSLSMQQILQNPSLLDPNPDEIPHQIPQTNQKIQFFTNQNKKPYPRKHIYIYIYIERERERERFLIGYRFKFNFYFFGRGRRWVSRFNLTG